MKVDEFQIEDATPVVLVVDDSADVHRLLKARLKTEDLELIHALNGAECLAAAKQQHPAIILLDLDMPDADGFQVLRALKDAPETLDIPVIILSGMSSPQDKVTAYDLGAVDYVTKPFDLTELRLRVRSALKMHKLILMLAQRAQIDGLTGLWNRRHFDSRLRDAVADAFRHDRPLSLAMLDIDNFKSVNDSFGHPAGDQVLIEIGKVLKRECRTADIACRFGGDEFTIIMPGTSPSDATVLCERIRRSLAETPWPKHPERPVTTSIGICGADGAVDAAPEQWIELTDKNLYAAKAAGRDRMIVSHMSDRPRLSKAG